LKSPPVFKWLDISELKMPKLIDLCEGGNGSVTTLLERCSSRRDCKRKPYRITELQRPRGVVPRCQSLLRDYMILKSHGNKKP